jgi:ABC-type phosphate transport system substrate-binding protein
VRRALLSFLVVAALAGGPAPVVCADARYRVIVHPGVKGTQIPRAALSSLFLKQASKWGDGTAAHPVDQSVRSPVRQAFPASVLRQGLVEVQVYWHRQMGAGKVPPPVKTSDEDVVAFVASTPGAIGYVSAETPLPDSVRQVAVID